MYRSPHGHRGSRVSRCVFNDRTTGFKLTRLERFVEGVKDKPIFYAAARIEVFAFAIDFGVVFADQPT